MTLEWPWASPKRISSRRGSTCLPASADMLATLLLPPVTLHSTDQYSLDLFSHFLLPCSCTSHLCLLCLLCFRPLTPIPISFPFPPPHQPGLVITAGPASIKSQRRPLPTNVRQTIL